MLSQIFPIMYFYSQLDAGVSCLPGAGRSVGTRGSHGSCPRRVSAWGRRDARPACAFQLVFVLFSLCITGYYHSFATAICPTRQPVFSITLSRLSPAPPVTQRGQDCQAPCRHGGRTGTCLQCRPRSRRAGDLHQPEEGPALPTHAPAPRHRSSVALREGGKGTGLGQGAMAEPEHTASRAAAALPPHR